MTKPQASSSLDAPTSGSSLISLIKQSIHDGGELFKKKRQDDHDRAEQKRQQEEQKRLKREADHEVTASLVLGTFPEKIRNCISSGSNLMITNSDMDMPFSSSTTLQFWDEVAAGKTPVRNLLTKCTQLGIKTTVCHIVDSTITGSNFGILIKLQDLLTLSGSL